LAIKIFDFRKHINHLNPRLVWCSEVHCIVMIRFEVLNMGILKYLLEVAKVVSHTSGFIAIYNIKYLLTINMIFLYEINIFFWLVTKKSIFQTKKYHKTLFRFLWRSFLKSQQLLEHNVKVTYQLSPRFQSWIVQPYYSA
jgi:hypothetical protein